MTSFSPLILLTVTMTAVIFFTMQTYHNYESIIHKLARSRTTEYHALVCGRLLATNQNYIDAKKYLTKYFPHKESLISASFDTLFINNQIYLELHHCLSNTYSLKGSYYRINNHHLDRDWPNWNNTFKKS